MIQETGLVSKREKIKHQNEASCMQYWVFHSSTILQFTRVDSFYVDALSEPFF